MDFFEKQEKARLQTKWLVFYFVLAVIGIIAVLHIGFSLLLGQPLDDWEMLGFTAAGVLVSVVIGSLVKIAELSKGGKAVADMLGGVPVNPSTADASERRLLNVVEEMSLASGVPVPQVYVLDEEAINAFAAGYGTADAAVGVTRGCIERLTRDELQGVIGHEFSHILNGDMRLNIRLMGLLNGILFLALLGGVLMRLALTSRPRSSNDKNGGSIVAALIAGGLVLYIVGWIGVFFGKLIKAAVSRQREFLADASAVQYTRNPGGLAGALSKISSHSSRLEHPKAQEASHMFFGNGMAEAWLGLFATHPPIQQRIAEIAPNFDPQEASPTLPPVDSAKPSFSGDAQLAAATSMLAGLPEFSRPAMREIHSSCALVFALLLSEDASVRQSQLAALEIDAALRKEIGEMFDRRSQLSTAQRISLVDLAIPVLRGLSPQQYSVFSRQVRQLIEADGQIHLFEYTLQKLLLRHLDAAFTKARPGRVQHKSLVPLLPDTGILLSAIANADDGESTALDAAFQAGVARLGKSAAAFPLARQSSVNLKNFDRALEDLATASLAVKKTILTACSAAVVHDGVVNDTQFELLRAIADTVDCPIPPFVPTT
ncbi:MAG: M48 family metallopeptidase [Verrucomicrobia bacterium]|nr:M48 family metallopeptidase [Verrucomicrobiota bacterium]